MKPIALTIAVAIVAAVAAFAAMPAETTHACGQLTVYNTVEEYVAHNNVHNTMRDNGDGTVTINPGSPNERTSTPQLGVGECPPGGDRPAGRLPEANNGPPPTSTTTYTVRRSRPTVVRNAVHDVEAYEGDFIDMNLRRFFRGNRLSFTAESNDPTVATVSFITNDRLRVRITATATKADPSVTGVTILCQANLDLPHWSELRLNSPRDAAIRARNDAHHYDGDGTRCGKRVGSLRPYCVP